MQKVKKQEKLGENIQLLDPRQQLCWAYYVDPKSDTFSNATQSALKAGYSAQYAGTFTREPWFREKLRTLNMLEKAEKNLNDFLEMDTKTKKMIQEELTEIDDTEKMRIKADITKFVAERIGKSKYSTRQEHTGSNGEPLILPAVIIEKNDIKPGTGNDSQE